MARKRLLRGVLAGQTAALALAVACGAMLPLGVDRDGQGMWSLHLNVALADRGRGGGSDGGGDDHGGGSGGGSDGGGSGGGSGGSGSSGGGSSGSGSGGSGSGDSGSGSSGGGGDDHGGSGSGGSDDGAAHDSSDDSGQSRRPGSDDGVSGRSAGSDDRSRPRATVEMSDSDVAAVMRGERVLVDDKGRVLEVEVEVEVERGVRTVTVKPHGSDARRNPGPIANVRTVDTTSQPSRSVVAHPVAGGFELEVEHGVVVQKPRGGAAATAVPAGRSRDPVQVGDDLSREQEADLIRGGWQ